MSSTHERWEAKGHYHATRYVISMNRRNGRVAVGLAWTPLIAPLGVSSGCDCQGPEEPEAGHTRNPSCGSPRGRRLPGPVWSGVVCPRRRYQMAMAGMPCIWGMQNGRVVCPNACCV